MHIKRRLAAVLALATAGVMVFVGVAMATSSTVSFKFTPTNPHAVFKSGKLNLHTHTNYTVGGQKTKRAQLYFDNDFKFNTSSVPKCNVASISGNITMAQAMTACGSSLVGTGTAKANAAMPGDVPACVLAFNANLQPGNKPGIALLTRAAVGSPTINCANPASNTNGNTTVLLQAPLANNPGSLGADYTGGKWLDFNNIDTASALPLSDFNVNVQKGTYVQGKCTDSNHKWNMQTKFTYINPAGTQTLNSQQACT